MRPRLFRLLVPFVLLELILIVWAGGDSRNLVADPSFEEPMARDRWGHVFARWGGWIYEGDCEFRVSNLARTGKHSLLMVAGNEPKIRVWPGKLKLSPGRYRVTAYLRGLDIGRGPDNESTEFMFDGNYIRLGKSGTFGWTPLTYVGDVTGKSDPVFPSFGLMAPGYLWVDDVSVEKVGEDVPLTPRPLLGEEEKPIEPPGQLREAIVHCPECGYRNDPHWGRCYACGTSLKVQKATTPKEAVKRIASFEEKNPFDGGSVVSEHATHGAKSLRIDRGYVSMGAAQNWTGYDYLKADVHNAAAKPLEVTIEINDRQTRDYWTRVNYTTVAPPGDSTLILPTALYVGEKSRPGRALLLDGITRLVFAIGDNPAGPLFLDNIRLDRDTETERVKFEGLWAFDVGPPGSPVMEGFTPLDARKRYTEARGYGWKDAKFWRAFDALQPDPLYRDFICIEKGGLALDVPNGKYHVIVNMDSPSGYWGEYQIYRQRALIVEDERYDDFMDRDSFKKRYFRFWDKEDVPGEDAFDKYQVPYFREKHVIAEVRDGQLNIEFEGENWACCVSAIIVYPHSEAAKGKRFLEFVKSRRRFHFDNAFKRVLHVPSGEAPQPDEAEKRRGFVVFARDWMQDVYHNDRPLPGERIERLTASAFAGELEPLTISVLPLRDTGALTLTVTDLAGPGDASIAAKQIDIGYVQHRMTRVTGEGSVYRISPRSIISRATAPMPEGITRTFWLTVHVPPDAAAGVYRGQVRLRSEHGGGCTVPLELTVRKGTLDAVDVPVGPFGHTIDLPWYEEEAAEWDHDMAVKSLRKLREYGFTTVTGLPIVTYKGSQNGTPQFDFTTADAQMKRLRDNGFRMPVISYCPFNGLNTYFKDEDRMRDAGFNDYSQFIRTVFGTVQAHADEAGWLPVYWNIGDEPIGEDLERSAQNAEAYRKAFPKGPPFFTAASSFKGSNRNDPHFRLSRALHIAEWNEHDEASVKLLRDVGGDWAHYNSGDRWTYGVYLYKAAKQFGLKFRVSWHWNASAGDPYYALDCREDDYAWCSANPDGELLSTPFFERQREGLDDYRRLLTLARLAKEHADSPAARDAEKLLVEILGGLHLGEREPKGIQSFARLRERLDIAIERLR